MVDANADGRNDGEKKRRPGKNFEKNKNVAAPEFWFSLERDAFVFFFF